MSPSRGGLRAPALPPGTHGDEAASAGLAAYRSLMVLRFALCEAVAIIALVAAFVVEPQTAKTYLVGGTFSLLLLAWHVWPTDRGIRRIEAQLDRDGGQSGLHRPCTGGGPAAPCSEPFPSGRRRATVRR